MNQHKLVSYTVRWSQSYAVDETIYKLQQQLAESLVEQNELREARQVLDRIRSKQWHFDKCKGK
jgi:predicted negative regulator of RcsB-dependent stress response